MSPDHGSLAPEDVVRILDEEKQRLRHEDAKELMLDAAANSRIVLRLLGNVERRVRNLEIDRRVLWTVVLVLPTVVAVLAYLRGGA